MLDFEIASLEKFAVPVKAGAEVARKSEVACGVDGDGDKMLMEPMLLVVAFTQIPVPIDVISALAEPATNSRSHSQGGAEQPWLNQPPVLRASDLTKDSISSCGGLQDQKDTVKSDFCDFIPAGQADESACWSRVPILSYAVALSGIIGLASSPHPKYQLHLGAEAAEMHTQYRRSNKSHLCLTWEGSGQRRQRHCRDANPNTARMAIHCPPQSLL